jgi:hypothetical protein
MRQIRSISILLVSLSAVLGWSVGAAAQDKTAPAQLPAEFTGHIACGPEVRSPTSETQGGVVQGRGGAWHPTATMSDRRLEGDYYISFDGDTYSSPAGTAVGAGTWRIENDEGAWQGSYTNVGFADGTASVVSTPLVGEGAYGGLTAIWESTYDGEACAWDVRGVIIEGDVPAAPEPFSGQG